MKAVISGICGMDGSHLADLLLGDGHQVYGFYRRSSLNRCDRINHLLNHPNLHLEEGDLCDSFYIGDLLRRVQPDWFFNTAAQSHVGTSFKQPRYTFEVNTIGVANILESILVHSPHTRMVQCSTSEMWGNSVDSDGRQRETTPFAPRSPYAVSKMAAHDLCKTYRESYGLWVCSTICHNHTSSRRGDNFVEKKVANWLAKNAFYLKNYPTTLSDTHITVSMPNNDKVTIEKLRLGNLESSRDFGHSKDYVRAMYMTIKSESPTDYVVATGIATKIEDIVEMLFAKHNLNYKQYTFIDPDLFRPAEVNYLCGDSTKIREELGWYPQYNLNAIADELVGQIHDN